MASNFHNKTFQERMNKKRTFEEAIEDYKWNHPEFNDDEDESYDTPPPGRKGVGITLAIMFVGVFVVYIIVATPNWDDHTQSVLKKMKILKRDPYQKPLINYEKYNLVQHDEMNCKDYAFAFVVLYGNGAEVVISKDHAFVRANGKKLEPQSNSGKLFFSTDYFIRDKIKITDEDKETIRSYFR